MSKTTPEADGIRVTNETKAELFEMKKCAQKNKTKMEKKSNLVSNEHSKHMHMKNIMKKIGAQEQEQKRKKSEILFGAGNEIKHLSKKFQFDRRI